MSDRRLVALATFAAASAWACAPAGGGDGGDPGDPRGKISTNGLDFDDDAVAELSSAPLGEYRESADEIRAADEHAALLSLGESGQSLLEYVASCALPESETLVASAPEGDGERALPGRIGLAPEWAEGACDESCQRWISACLLAHANGDAEPFPIALQGDHPELVWPESLAEEFSVEEAAFYGNVFAEGPETYACIGRGLFDGSWTGQSSYLEGRICGLTGSGCGLETTGTCHSITGDGIADSSTCERGGEGETPYAQCSTGASGGGADAYEEVITVYLEP